MACKLCRQNKELRNSHIIPEFLYKSLYDDKHRAIHLKDISNAGFTKLKPLQKGLRERLLCHDCEQLLNDKYEKYFKQLWIDSGTLPQILKAGESKKLTGIDYQKFKLFHLSVLFRAGVSSLYEFRQVKLGSYEDAIREIVFYNKSTLDTDYVILCHAIIKNGGQIQDGIIVNPFKKRQPGGYNSYGFCFGGCVWYYILDKRKISDFSNFMLNSNGELTIISLPWQQFLNI